MKKHYRWVIIGGIIIFILPLLGIPYFWKMITEFVVGLGLVLLGLIEKQMFVYTEPADEPAFEESDESVDKIKDEKEII